MKKMVRSNLPFISTKLILELDEEEEDEVDELEEGMDDLDDDQLSYDEGIDGKYYSVFSYFSFHLS